MYSKGFSYNVIHSNGIKDLEHSRKSLLILPGLSILPTYYYTHTIALYPEFIHTNYGTFLSDFLMRKMQYRLYKAILDPEPKSSQSNILLYIDKDNFSKQFYRGQNFSDLEEGVYTYTSSKQDPIVGENHTIHLNCLDSILAKPFTQKLLFDRIRKVAIPQSGTFME